MLAFLTSRAVAADLKPADVEFFEKKIRPVLVEHCFECHSAKADEIGGGLLLDNRAAVAKGGENGAVVVKGNPDKSRLITALRYSDENLQMPPDEKLPANVIADFERWVKLGAPDPKLDESVLHVQLAQQNFAFSIRNLRVKIKFNQDSNEIDTDAVAAGAAASAPVSCLS